ncbi:glycoside hydrolase family 3 N-terminal domain-containing protein [Streptomyces sp. WI04-05B]|uniref:beta-xylosidase/alpha-l-arabinosidase n=1 Tax=Streptomyces TaxID=1883 RepID=UPI0029A50DAB|nr:MULTISPECIES: glycoside hydrolase family 3 N-terminal domain-containing protein [unclassified Streptomyces]MDX2543883.1 glycoside hydrolase family 3 N-terminal domain-containing protein [Streptomyces sp. WI04-05B]MDX2584407.1 glycoside hydrolase family 3 N-terminal domain-containing protein [Streptomyces sp. WI04-05A]MDX3753309.1 glycoside hydrolase family 3 N-terminal domain-containing protein [Streptomyces sp. AK08-02]
MTTAPWRDRALSADDRVDDLLSRMTLEEKTAQLYGVWVGASTDGHGVAPHQHDLTADYQWDELITQGLGQLTRPFGTAPVDPTLGAQALARAQRRIVGAGRFGIPALAHEECLAGFTAWRATAYPVPLAWGATFHPELVEEMAARIGHDLASVGVHQGLAPVLDVVRDSRWGRVEETIGEDPYLVGTIGSAYVRGLESAGIIATLKHFAGYAGSVGARNLAPVRAGSREFADLTLPPFEMALRDGGARSVMAAYTETDGVPASADPYLLTQLLREEWGFTGTVVSDYFGIAFLQSLHRIAGTPAEAGHAALAAGIDVELPSFGSYGEALVTAVRAGEVPESLVDRAARRVLTQKCELGLLDEDWRPEPADGPVDLDSAGNRALARRLAEESVVLLGNPDGLLPLAPDTRIAVVGPRAADSLAMLGCYSFPSHVLPNHPETPLGIDIPTLLESLRTELPDAKVTFAEGCDTSGPDVSGFEEAVAKAAEADVCVAVMGDRAGLFGGGTSGEGCDVAELQLPGVQAELLDALVSTGVPVVLVLLSGRPYALGRWHGRLASVVQAFFPGEEGGPAVAGVLSGRVNPSGRLPVSVPRERGGQPWTYLQPPLGLAGGVSSLDPTPLYPFGHGLSYTSFTWEDFTEGGPAEIGTDGSYEVSVTVRNTGARAGAEVVQLYLHDPVASVTRPDVRLIGYERLELAPGAASRVTFRFHADLSAFTDRAGRRVVEPGVLELRLGASSADVRHAARVRLVGSTRELGADRRMRCGTSTDPVG